MALVVSSRPNLRATDPTASLEEALASFENALTEGQKTEYNSCSIKPDVSSVIVFVAQTDAENKCKSRKSLAPRLCTFLNSTQQFTGVVDTFVSSHPAIAALVWGSVKTAILTASNIASYFDKVTNLIMDIGKSCPTYEQFGHLYPGCVGLQRALCDYFAVIVRLCIEIIEIPRRTVATQILSAIFNPFESEFKAFLEDLDKAVKAVQMQVSLASKQAAQETAQLVELESKRNEAHRHISWRFHRDARDEYAQAHQWRVQTVQRDAAKMRSAIRDNLSTIDHAKPWRQAIKQRVPDTAEWFQREAAFRDWRGDDQTSILWCSGTMGMGKTILLSNIVAHIYASRKQCEAVAYYFCRPDHEESLRARSILGSLARQILDTHIEHAQGDMLRSLCDASQGLDAADIVDFVIPYMDDHKTYYVILDGLDECRDSEVRKVALSLTTLCHRRVKDLKILCAGRPELEETLLRKSRPKYRLGLVKKKIEPDIERYVATTLERCLEDERLKLGDGTLILRIVNALREGSDGM